MTDKAQFYWAVVGDANPEPVAVTMLDGRRVAYTIGCADPFEVDGPESAVELLRPDGIWTTGGVAAIKEPEPMRVPAKTLLPELESRRAETEKRLERDRKRGIHHSWQRFNP